MAINQPKLTGDTTTDAWTKSVTDNLNQLELDFQTQLEVTDIRSSNWNGQDSVPSDILNEGIYPDLASREEVIGTEGYFLDASDGIITAQDVIVRGDLASANFQVTGGTDGFFFDGQGGRMFTNTTIARGSLANAAVANLYGGVGFNGFPANGVSSIPQGTDGWGIDAAGNSYFRSVRTNPQLVFQTNVTTDRAVEIDFVNNTATSTASGSPALTGLSVGDLLPGATYTALVRWTDTRDASNFRPEAGLVDFTLPPAGIDLTGSVDDSGNGIIGMGEVHGNVNISFFAATTSGGSPTAIVNIDEGLGNFIIEYDGANTDSPRILRLARNGTITNIDFFTIGVTEVWRKL